MFNELKSYSYLLLLFIISVCFPELNWSDLLFLQEKSIWGLYRKRQNINRNLLTTLALLPLSLSLRLQYFYGRHTESLPASVFAEPLSSFNCTVYTTPIKRYIALSLPHLSSISPASSAITLLWIHFLQQCWSVGGKSWASFRYRQTALQCIINRHNDCVLFGHKQLAQFTDNIICHIAIQPEGMWPCYDWTEQKISFFKPCV